MKNKKAKVHTTYYVHCTDRVNFSDYKIIDFDPQACKAKRKGLRNFLKQKKFLIQIDREEEESKDL